MVVGIVLESTNFYFKLTQQEQGHKNLDLIDMRETL